MRKPIFLVLGFLLATSVLATDLPTKKYLNLATIKVMVAAAEAEAPGDRAVDDRRMSGAGEGGGRTLAIPSRSQDDADISSSQSRRPINSLMRSRAFSFVVAVNSQSDKSN